MIFIVSRTGSYKPHTPFVFSFLVRRLTGKEGSVIICVIVKKGAELCMKDYTGKYPMFRHI